MWTLLTSLVLAAPIEPELTWNLSINGKPVGTRTAKIRIVPGDHGTRRIIESYTSVSGSIGPVPLEFRQRLTAHAEGADPASFHSVVDQGGDASEIQGRFTPSGWTVSTNTGGRLRTTDFSPSRIDLSTADLLDPESRIGFARMSTIRLLSAETGDILQGTVDRLGSSELTIAKKKVAVEGFSWTSPEGTSSFWFSPEGYLVKYEIVSFGIPIEGLLSAPPPAGIDDFPVRVHPPAVERIPL